MTQEGILCIIDLNGLNESGQYFAFPRTTRLAALWTCCWYASQTQCWVRVAATGTLFMVDFLMSSLQSAHIPWRTIGRARQGKHLLSSDSRVLRNQVTLESRPIPWVSCKGVNRSEERALPAAHTLILPLGKSAGASSKLGGDTIKIMTFLMLSLQEYSLVM